MKKTYILSCLVFIFALSILITPIKGDETYTFTSRGQYVHKSFHGEEGDHCSWGYTFNPYGTVRAYVLNNSAWEEAISFDNSDYLYSWGCGCDYGSSGCKGGFTVPYEDTWHVVFRFEGVSPTLFIITKWEITKPSTPSIPGFNLFILLGVISLTAIIIKKKF